MRTLRKNKQEMYFSVYSNSDTIYEVDENGDIVYTTVDGEQVPVEIGTMDVDYSTPELFYGTITSNLSEVSIRSYGVDQSAVYSKLIIPKGLLDLKIGTLVWRESPIEWKDAPTNTIPKPSSADFIVMGYLKEYKSFDEFLLRRVSDKDGVVSE